MATYAIGDLHGCLDPLERLLERLRFDPATDRLWFVGDLVNRGPQSLDTLRYVRDLGPLATVVLGNHDLHLLAVVHGVRAVRHSDTFDEILAAPDRDSLIDWLRQRPLLHHDGQRGLTMVHAGLHPAWDLDLAMRLARELETVIGGDDYVSFLKRMYGNEPSAWRDDLTTHERQRFALNVFTRMRYLDRAHALEFEFSGPPARATPPLIPWYRARRPRHRGLRILFGHWSSHPAMGPPDVVPIDRGYVWQGALAAFDIDAGYSLSERAHATVR